MYKSKLQELCQKQKRALPKYTCIKDGEDHCPLFKAAVVVGGATFDTSAACKSSKQACNEAAKLAFLHFTSDPSNQSENVEKTNYKEEAQNSDAHSADMAVKQDIQDQFKKKLKMYAQRKNLDIPVYHTEKDGLCFRGHVSIGEEWFQSQELFGTMDEAENAAAQAALLSLSIDAFHEILSYFCCKSDPISYKNLLQELMNKEGYSSPTYTITESNHLRGQTFLSTVAAQGEVFQGTTAKSKKLAELSAAKAAYTTFVERKLFQPGNFSPRPSNNDALELAPSLRSATISDHQENQTTEMKCYLLCNRVKVFTRIPNTALPEGVVLLPISENRWTLVSLEFPGEKSV